MMFSYTVVLAILLLAVFASSFNLPNFKANNNLMQDLQKNMKKSLASLAIVPLILGSSSVAHAEDIKSYWGVGCFWHAQHEFIGAEQRILGRTDEQLTVSIGNLTPSKP